MANENLQKWALIAEIVGGTAVIISLIFVGLEIRQSSEETVQNTIALEVGAYQDLISQISDMNILIIQDPEFAYLYSRMLSCEKPADDIEAQRIITFITLNIRHGDMAYKQFESGLIDQNDLDSVLTPLVTFLHLMQPGQPRWQQLKPVLNSEFVSYVDERVEQTRGLYFNCRESQ